MFSILTVCAACTNVHAQTIVKRHPAIAEMCAEVNADSLKSYIQTMVAFGTRNTLSNQSSGTRGIGAAKNWVLQKFQEFGKGNKNFSALIDTTSLVPNGKRIDRNVLLGNVMATLKGTSATDKRVFIITGHLDNMRTNVMDSTGDAPGANDDASGVAAVLECARIMSKNNFPATVIFMAVSGEEQGLLGANFFADKSKENKLAIEAVLNNDIMGSNNSNGTKIINNTKIRVFSEGLPFYELDKNAARIRQLGLENDGASRQLARYTKEIGERYVDNIEVILVYRNDRFLRGGDHTPFVENGFAAVRFTEMNENYEHQHQDVRVENGVQYGDLLEFMDFEYLRKNTAVNLANLSNLAMAPSVPQKFLIDVSKLSNSTSLEWEKPAHGNTVGYYILVRETTSAVWQKKIFTSDLKITLPHSKDNYFFAIQSVNADGNESLPIVPEIKGR